MFFCNQRSAEWPAAKETAAQSAGGSWWEFQAAARAFGLAAGYKRRDVDAAFRQLAVKAHPDMGGTHDAFQTLVEQRNLLLSLATF